MIDSKEAAREVCAAMPLAWEHIIQQATAPSGASAQAARRVRAGDDKERERREKRRESGERASGLARAPEDKRLRPLKNPD